MKKLLLILFTAGISPAFGQLLMPLQYDTTVIGQELILSGDSEYHSTSLHKGFANRIIHGGAISNSVKDHTFGAQKNNINHFGKDIQADIEYRNYKVNMFGSEKWGFVIKGGYYFIGSGSYSKDFFGLAFYGNDSYLGRSADFSGMRASFTGFQKVGFGIIQKKSKSSITLNLINVSNSYAGKVIKGNLDQAADGSNISLLLDGNFAYTNQTTFANGTGLALDLDFRIPIAWTKERKAFIQLQAKNLGLAYMHQGLKSYSVDSTYHYSGFTFDQLFQDKPLFSKDFSVLDSLSIRTSDRKRFVALPCMFQVGKIVDEHYAGKLQSFFGIRAYPSLSYIPLLYVGGNWRAASWVDLGLSGSYGGFGTFRAGFYASLKYKAFNLGLGTEDIYGLVSKNAFGESFNFRLRCKF